jgi:tetratricopeptide (TPR) repeat protein
MSSIRRTLFFSLLAPLAAVCTSAPANAQTRFSELPAGDAYRSCVQLVRKDPESGFEAAIAWRDEGGGSAARHCTALALVNLGQYADAALRLETLAKEMNGFGETERAAVLGQSGRVWRRAGDLDRARASLSAAIGLDPTNAELRIDRGEILATAGQYWEAIDDFNAALEHAPMSLDALIFRGAAYRLLNIGNLAREDLEAALVRDTGNPEALVELGAVELLDSRRDAARQHWLRAISVAPASPAADAARRWLEKLDVKADQP